VQILTSYVEAFESYRLTDIRIYMYTVFQKKHPLILLAIS